MQQTIYPGRFGRRSDRALGLGIVPRRPILRIEGHFREPHEFHFRFSVRKSAAFVATNCHFAFRLALLLTAG